MAKSKKIKQKLGDNSFEDVYFAADAINVDLSNGYNLEKVIGSVDIENKGDLQTQFNNIYKDIIGIWGLVDSWED